MHYLNIHLKLRCEDWTLPLWRHGSWLQNISPVDCCWLDCWSIVLCSHLSQHVPSFPLPATLPCTLLRPWLCITHCGVSNGWEPLLSKSGSWRHACEWRFMLDSNKLCISERGNIGAQKGVRYMWEVLIPGGVNAQGTEVWAGCVRFKEEGGYKEERIEWSWGQLISKPPRGGYGKDQRRWKLAQISSISSTYTTTFQMFNNTIKNISWHFGMAK